MNVKELRIIVEPDKIEITRTVGLSGKGQINQEYIKLELGIAKIFHKMLNKYRLTSAFDKNDYEILGKTLFKVLFFEPSIQKFFLDELAEVKESPNTYCRIYLHFRGLTNDIPELPWEYMLVDDKDRKIKELYLAADSDCLFDLVRIVKENKISFEPQPDQKLNVALIISNPRNEPDGRMPLNIEELSKCFDRLNKKFGNIIKTNEREDERPIFIKFENDLADVVAQFNDEPYILHFYGHAQVKDKESLIGFTDDNQKLSWVSDKDFASIFHPNAKIRKPQLIILQACESGQVCNADAEDPGGLAYALAMNDIPAVVAMQNIVREDVSIDFIEQFYTSLLNGEDVARAVPRGRRFLGCGNRRNGEKRKENEKYENNTFGTPLLFISTIQPIRLMPEKVQDKDDKRLVNKRCAKCQQPWPNVRMEKEICTLNRCGGKLVLEESAGDNKLTAPDERAQLTNLELSTKTSLN